MKRILSLIIAAAVMIIPMTARCDDNITVTLDGKELTFDVPPQITDGRTLVPMRAIFEALGAEVKWNGEMQHIIAETQNKHIDMFIGGDTISITKNGDTFAEMIKLDVPPQITDGRTLVPIRAVSESLDCIVQWDGETQTVIITSPPAILIDYDDTNERQAHYVSQFKIKDIQKIDGSYKITYSIKTFFEGRSPVSVTFDCLNSAGKVIDNFGGMFQGTDYTWSEHETEAVISDKTVKIQLHLN